MNEQALRKPEKPNSTATGRRLAPFGWFIRIAAISAIVFGGFSLLYSDYLDLAPAEAESAEFDPLKGRCPVAIS